MVLALMRPRRCDMKFIEGEEIEVCGVPWKGVKGRYVRKAFLGHIVEVGDLISGGTPRRVHVGRIRKWARNSGPGRS